MPVTHGSTSESTDATAPITASNVAAPPIGELTTASPCEGTVFSHALHRAITERLNPRPVVACFDNKLSPDFDSEPTDSAGDATDESVPAGLRESA